MSVHRVFLGNIPDLRKKQRYTGFYLGIYQILRKKRKINRGSGSDTQVFPWEYATSYKKEREKSPIRVRYNRVLLGNIKWRHKRLLRSYTCINRCRNLKKTTVHSRSLSSIEAFLRKLRLFFGFALVNARNDQKVLLFCQKVLRIFEDL